MMRPWGKLALISLIALTALAAVTTAANAGSFAPAPRVVVTLERDFLEGSGSQNLQELLDTGIIRYLLTGGQSLPVLVNGAPYSSTTGDLDALPLAAMERIEVLGGESLGTFGGDTVRNALNVVLREDWDGTAVRALARQPSRKGGDGHQGNASWSGKVGEGRLSVTAGTFRRQHIASADRDYSRGKWTPGGSFADASNISKGGNTVFIAKLDSSDELKGFRSVALGDCDPAEGYTGPLTSPPGPPVPDTDYGCGFDYSSIMWETSDVDQQTVLLNARHPLGDSAEISVVANFSQFETDERYAPSVGTFRFEPDAELLAAINADETVADGNDRLRQSPLRGPRQPALADKKRSLRHHGRRRGPAQLMARLRRRTEPRPAGQDRKGRYFRSRRPDSGGDFGGQLLPAESAQPAGRPGRAPPAGHTEHQPAPRNRRRLRVPTPSRGAGGIGLFHRRAKGGMDRGRRDKPGGRASFPPFRRPRRRGVRRFKGSGRGRRELRREARNSGRVRRNAPAGGGTVRPAVRGPCGRLRRRGRAALLARRGRIPAHGRADRAGFLERGAACSRVFRALCHRGPGPSLCRVRPRPRPAPPRTCSSANELQVQRYTEGNADLDPAAAERLAAEAAFRNGPYRLSVEWFRESLTEAPGNQTADSALRSLPECPEGVTSDCVRWAGGAVIHDRFANVVDAKTEGFTARFGAGFETTWGGLGAYGTWRRETATRLTVDGVPERVVRPKDMLRARFSARRGGVRAIWTASYRSGFTNQQGTGRFSPWTGHDLRVDWTNPWGLEGLRITGGIFNLTDKGYTVDSANPGSTDGPTVAGWGRTYFLALSTEF